jgi:hypothetical protein
LSCSGGNGFVITQGASQTITASQGAVPVAVQCTRLSQQQSGTLQCTETATIPAGAPQNRSWGLLCPVGQSSSSATLSVGRVTAVPNVARRASPAS